MPLRLILMRHAKSSWGDAALSDHDRPLNARGRRSAALLGDWLRAKGYQPEAILCSSAARTRETADRLRLAGPVTVAQSLYLAAPAEILRAVSKQLRRSPVSTLLVVGHNPGIASVSAGLLSTPPTDERFFSYPTGATAVIDFPSGGGELLTVARGSLVAFTVPRELERAAAR